MFKPSVVAANKSGKLEEIQGKINRLGKSGNSGKMRTSTVLSRYN